MPTTPHPPHAGPRITRHSRSHPCMSRVSKRHASTKAPLATILVGRGASQPRKNHRSSPDRNRRNPQDDGPAKRRRRGEAAAAAAENCGAPITIEGERFSILTWNIDGLRAFLADAARTAALIGLLRTSPLMLCLLEHKLQEQGASSDEARAGLEKLADGFGYDATWTFSPRAGLDGLVVLVKRSSGDLVTPPTEPRLASEPCVHERRLLHVSCMTCISCWCTLPTVAGRGGSLSAPTNGSRACAI